MKEVFHKTISLAMAVLLLLSTTSWKVEKHYCMGHLMDVAFFSDVDTCGMDMSDHADTKMQQDNSCCNDEVIVIDGQDDLKLSFNDLGMDQQSFLVAFTYSYIDLFETLAEQAVPHKQYPPPILVKDIQLLDEVFLI